MVDRYGINGIAVVTGLMVAAHGLISSFWVRRATGIRTHCGPDSIADVAREIRRLLQDNLSGARARP